MEGGTTTDHHQDFSFPLINDDAATSSAIDSPPLWCSSPAPPYSNSWHEQEVDEGCKDRLTTAEEHPLMIKEREKRVVVPLVEIEKEKMDMLWEDFNNDELFKRNEMECDHDVVSIGCVEALRFSKPPPTTSGGGGGRGGGVIFSPRKPSFVVFINVLKKLFLLHHHHHRSVVKPPPPTCHRQKRHQSTSRGILI